MEVERGACDVGSEKTGAGKNSRLGGTAGGRYK